jgi:hypothetical protein
MTDQDVKEIHEIIPDPQAFKAEVERAFAHPSATVEGGAAASGGTAAYCQVWPHVSQGLTLLKEIAPFIPGVGMMVALAIPLVLAAGRAAHHSLCDGEE